MRVLRPAALVALAVLASAPRPDAQGLPFALFERYLESLRQETGIPGISAVIVQGRDVVWRTGLGKQDLERSINASDDTPYPIGDLTQTVAAVLLGQCVEQAGLSIDQPIRRWTDSIPEGAATIRHVLAHASSGVPGESFRYDAARYAALTNVVSDCGDRPFRTAVYEEIFDRLGMRDSVPGLDLADLGSRDRSLFSDSAMNHFANSLQRLATPYRVDRSGKATRSEYPAEDVNAATGLISSASDLGRFDAALNDDGVLLRSDLLSVAWSNVTTRNGAPLPSGLGWFVQNYNGERLVWHFGSTPGAASSLLVKIPRRRLTLILLANSDGLSPSSISEGDVTASLFAKLFLRVFVG
jgi:CubicO group peptidase (beta-lactamase class C family)